MPDALEHAIYRLMNTPILQYPYPHFFIENVFPRDFYWELISTVGSGHYEPLQGGYKARVATSEMPPCMEAFTGDNQHRFTQMVMAKFYKEFYERFPANERPEFRSEWRFIRDSEGYSIGPHTDAPHKVVSMLFYLQALKKDENGFDFHSTEHGTGIYVPKDGRKTCRGGPHHKFDGFNEVWRAPFLRNSCFVFWKTANSWHAVKEISDKITRDVLLFNIFAEAAR